ncbi:TIGR00269 family protein [Candidatus Woesearchaeota archaeon]|nr:TIGR00269 family protein [Candidatus Woesearchaeota archaeon]
MHCSRCKKKPVILKPLLCKDHFIRYFEKKVHDTVKNFSLLSNKQKVVVATSGGKDSLTCLYLLKKFGYEPTALIIDEGIREYRKKTLEDLKTFCRKFKINLIKKEFEKEFGKTLDQILNSNSKNPCTVCGILRRYLLNKYSKGFDVIATGHNLDDEAQAVVMNLLRNNSDLLFRLGPVSGNKNVDKFTKRIKPLYFCSEKEIKIYSILNKITSRFTECPYVEEAYRMKVRDFLNDYEQKKPGTKKNIIESFLSMKKNYVSETKENTYCERCGEPSASDICNTCKLIKEIKLKV